MPWDISDPYRDAAATDEDLDAEWLYGPRVLDQFTAEERELNERARVDAMREIHENGSAGIYHPPFGQGAGEPDWMYGDRLHDALKDSDERKLTTCKVSEQWFRIRKAKMENPLFCSDACRNHSYRADKNRARDNRRDQR